MSRSITIPEYKNPFVVIINNTVYEYKGGETVEVPDEVAEAIEDALEEIPKPKRYLSLFALRTQGNIENIAAVDLDGCTVISAYSFYMCENLLTVNIPSSVVSLRDRSFGTCYNLKTVSFAEDSQLETIEGNAFAYDYRLNTINIPKGVKTIGESSFAYCKGLSRVTLKAIAPPTIQANTFLDVPTTCVIEVPAESVDAYKAAPNWSALASQIKAIEE